MSSAAIVVRGLHKVYRDVVAVEDVSFDIEAGEIFGIIGPNGSGKTTTIECLQGLRSRDGGEVSVLGLDPRHEADALRRRIGSQLQESALPGRMRVWEALDLFASLAPGARDWRSMAREWGLWEKRDAAFATLSGGQRQRLFIAIALLTAPQLVFLDEMTTGLDPFARRSTWELIRQVRERGTTVVLVTHFMDEAETLCDRIAVFRSGRVEAIDSPGGLIRRFTAGLTVRFSAEETTDVSWLSECPGATAVEREGRSVKVSGNGGLLAHVGAALVAHGLAPEDLSVSRETLEDVFVRLTQAQAER